uniref:Uncharacterized protein n=1 Tax=Gopherus evgoodei TaxID=1825980 RepID=A0A8C4YCU9_9SAUR
MRALGNLSPQAWQAGCLRQLACGRSPVPWIRRQPMGGPPKPRDQRTLRRLPACCPHGDRQSAPCGFSRQPFHTFFPG